jgi:hypothetical protein
MKLAASFFAVFCGWAVAFALLLLTVGTYSYNTFGYITDFDFLLSAPLLFTTIGWFLFGLPFFCLVRSDSSWMRWPRSALTGLLLSSAAYWVLIGWAVWPVWYFHLFAAIVGLIAAPIYCWLIHYLSAQRSYRRLVASFALVCFPILLFLSIQFVIWPVVELRLPKLAYRVGTFSVQTRIRHRLLRQLKPGDTLEEIRWGLGMVDRQITSYSTHTEGQTFVLSFKDGVVQEVRWYETNMRSNQQLQADR